MGLYRAGLVIVSTGVVTFGLVFTLLQATRSAAAPDQVGAAATPTAAAAFTMARAADSVAARVAPGRSAVGLPIGGSAALLRDIQPGDRLDVLASLPSAETGRPMTAIVVRGATVIRPASNNDPLLLEVSSTDAIALAHLVLSGTRLGYAIWPANGGSPPATAPLDERTARLLLGLPPVEEPAAIATPEPQPQPQPQPPPQPQTQAIPEPSPTPSVSPGPTSGFIYQAQAGETWASVAASFGLAEADLRRFNDAVPDASLEPGTLLIVPRRKP